MKEVLGAGCSGCVLEIPDYDREDLNAATIMLPYGCVYPHNKSEVRWELLDF